VSPPVAPPFPFYIINKDIIKGSFPFRKTFHTPKPDFEARFRPPRVFRRPEEPKQNHGNGTNRRRRTLCQLKPISQPRFQPPRVFLRPEEPEQNHENGTNRRRRTLCLPKPDFTTPISQPDFDRPACSADPKSRNRTTETEQTGGEGKFSSPENTPIQRLFYLCPRRLQNPIPDITVRFVRKSAFKPPPAPLLPGKPADRKA
jgi:hypothetical protein